ncbi:MAG TPA: cyanophycinase, partial [Segetibacter sp.]
MWRSTLVNNCPVPAGILVVIGGKEDKGDNDKVLNGDESSERTEILQKFIQLTGKDNPVVEVITTASKVEDEIFEDYKKVFTGFGITQVNQIHHKMRKHILEEDMSERVQNADAFFFTGGDQLLLTSIYGGSPFLTHLKERYITDKIVIGGTSAGAMAFSTPMIYAGNKQVQQIAGEVKVTTGLEFLRDVCIDTHFIDRSRFVRMAQVIATNPGCIGIGIEEDTALIVREGVNAEVIGNGVITVIEGFSITTSNVTQFSEQQPIGIQDLKVHLLPRG